VWGVFKIKNEEDVSTSMTDDLPISNLAKNRKIIVENCKDSIGKVSKFVSYLVSMLVVYSG